MTRQIKSEGYRTRAGKPWSPAVVYKLLTNVWYIGSYRYNVRNASKGFEKRSPKEWIEIPNHHIAAIDELRFERIQFILKRGRRGGVPEGETYVRKHVHIFAGLITCGMCGANMSATKDRRRADGWRPSIYGCSTRRRDKENCCNKYASDFYLVPFIFSFLANIIQARESVTPGMSEAKPEKNLLRGSCFSGVHIPQQDIAAIKDLLLSGETGMEYKPSIEFAS